jgi:2-polyprenyl-3-methyl-5-hydroxy-6-metoxy-1,4-benzoquinol methylase
VTKDESADEFDQAARDRYPFTFRKLKIPDSTLSEINSMLDWRAGTLLDGRILGRLGVTPGKRTSPGRIPDYRIEKLHQLVNLTGKSILEVGCFEGIHTLGLKLYSDDVTAIDIRPLNVVKTLARLSMHGANAKVFVADVEELSAEFGQFDVVFHCGVLYHLMSPVEHLLSLGPVCNTIFLDTHVARDEAAIIERKAGEFLYRGAYHGEADWLDPFSGKDAQSFWLTKESLREALLGAGFSLLTLIEDREERNGPRVAILAAK